jgi:tetratricopeptide (TPR) repeat protein
MGFEEHHQKNKALSYYNKAIEIDPKLPRPYANRSSISFSKHDYAGALADVDRAIRLAPGQAEFLVIRCEFHLAAIQLNEAIKDCSTAVSEDDQSALAHRFRGSAYYLSGDYSRAIEDFAAAILLDPSNPRYYNQRGDAYTDSGNTARAEADYKSAIALKKAKDIQSKN